MTDLPTERDVSILGSRVLRPSRPQLKPVRAALRDVTEPREAWEILSTRDLLPGRWLDDPQRKFRNGWNKSVPPTVSAVAAVASDPDGVMRAEELARETVRRCKALGFQVASPTTVTWWFLDPAKVSVYSRRSSDVFATLGNHGRIYASQNFDATPPQTDRLSRALADAVRKANPVADFTELGERPWEGSWLAWMLRDLLRDVWNLRGWRFAARGGAGIPKLPEGFDADENLYEFIAEEPFEGDWDNRDPNRRSFETIAWSAGWSDVRLSELPDPFEPLWALWETGYVLGDFVGREINLQTIEAT